MITYKQGNLLDSGCKVICHQVNCQGVMGSGIAKEIRYRYPEVYKTFRKTFLSGGNKLGSIDIVFEQQDDSHQWVWICNMYAQNHYLPRGINHTNYDAFRMCIQKLKAELNHLWKGDKLRIGFPYKIGCGLGGGDWSIVKRIIEEEFAGDEYNVEIWKLQ